MILLIIHNSQIIMMKVTLTIISHNDKQKYNYYKIRCVHKEFYRKNSITNVQKKIFYFKSNPGFLRANKTALSNIRVLIKSPPSF